jgi:hypothetical protein
VHKLLDPNATNHPSNVSSSAATPTQHSKAPTANPSVNTTANTTAQASKEPSREPTPEPVPELPDDIAICVACSKEIPSVLSKDKTILTISELVASNAVGCKSCGAYYHTKCLEHWTPVVELKIRSYEWECEDCKFCSVCDQAGDEDQLLFCDDCDRGFHLYCLEPPMEKIPEGMKHGNVFLNLFAWFVPFV